MSEETVLELCVLLKETSSNVTTFTGITNILKVLPFRLLQWFDPFATFSV